MFSLWKGTWPTVWRNVPGSALYFMTLDYLRSLLRSMNAVDGSLTGRIRYNISPEIVNLISGSASRVGVGFVMMPLSVVKVRFESNLYNYQSMAFAFKDILKENGVRGLFYGAGATAMRDGPFAGLYVMFYESCKPKISGMLPINSEPAVNMTSGFISAVAATSITQPFDMIKTRIQLKPREYRNLLQGFGRIASEEGILGFFSGMIPRLVRKSLSSAISWTVYEEVVRRAKH